MQASTDYVFDGDRMSFPYQRHFERKPDIVRRVTEQLHTGTITPMFHDQVITPTFTDDAVGELAEVARTGADGVFHAVGRD